MNLSFQKKTDLAQFFII